jgi:hypoxanthine phosphoribosyltransferase
MSDGDGAAAEILITADAVQRRVGELAAEISADYDGRELLLVCVLKGAVLFLADLMRALTVPSQVEFMAVSSYGDATETSGVVKVLKDLDRPIEGHDVLVVEDIVDSGLTLQYVLGMLGARNPASLEVCALLTKPERRLVELAPRYVGFEIPDRFVVGYGLDHAERLRHLPHVAVLQ